MTSPLLISLIVALGPFSHAVRPTFPVDVLSSTATSDRIASKESSSVGHNSSSDGDAAPKQEMASSHIAIAPVANGAFIALSSMKNATLHSKVTSRRNSSLTIGAPLSEGVDINDEWMDYLFNLCDEDGGGDISDGEWKKIAKGQWGPLLWTKLDSNGDKTVDEKEFKSNWDTAVSAAFQEMGAKEAQGGTTISKKAVEAWKPAAKFEKDFALTDLMGDGLMTCEEPCMDRASFEEFIFTVLFFRAFDHNNSNGKLTAAEVEKHLNRKESGKLKPLKGLFGDTAAFTKEFGKDGMELSELLKFENKKKVFVTDDPELKTHNEAVIEAGKSGSERAVLARAVLALSLVFAFQ